MDNESYEAKLLRPLVGHVQVLSMTLLAPQIYGKALPELAHNERMDLEMKTVQAALDIANALTESAVRGVIKPPPHGPSGVQ